MTTVFRPICYDCARLIPESRTDAGPLRCAAYPRGVPAAILQSLADHRQPYEDDGGLQFVARDPAHPGAVSHNPLLAGGEDDAP